MRAPEAASVSASQPRALVQPILVTGLRRLFLDSITVVAITGQVPTAMIGHDAFQEV
jgi:glyoxylate carboligase